MDEDYPARPEIKKPLCERSNRCGSESSTLETDVYVWRYTLLRVLVHVTTTTRRRVHWHNNNHIDKHSVKELQFLIDLSQSII